MQASDNAQSHVEELVRKAQEADAASLSGLYEHFYDKIFRYVSFRTGSPLEAEDITEEVFLRMLEKIHSFKRRGHPFSSWLFRIAHNLVVDHFRKRARKGTVPLEGTAEIATAASDLDSRVELTLRIEQVQRAIEGLTSLQREVISLRFAGELSVSETARAVGRSENAVKALQHAGLKKLRRLLNSEPSMPVAVRYREA